MIPGIILGALKLGSELIEDKDKKNELAFKTMEKLLESKTYRLVDALVKLAYATEIITKGLIRPLGATALMVFGIYAKANGIETGDLVDAACFGSLPAWGVSRHQEKIQKAKKKPSEEGKGWEDYED